MLESWNWSGCMG